MPTLELLIGPIASGKSTYAATRAREGGVLVVNDDAVVMMVHGGNYNGYDQRLRPVYKTIEHAAIVAGLLADHHVIVDRTCNDARTRRRYVELGRLYNASVIATVFPRQSPDVHAQRRFKTDPRGYTLDKWREVARRHEEQYEQVTIAEGYDRVIGINVSHPVVAPPVTSG
jgi:predicted kinase